METQHVSTKPGCLANDGFFDRTRCDPRHCDNLATSPITPRRHVSMDVCTLRVAFRSFRFVRLAVSRRGFMTHDRVKVAFALFREVFTGVRRLSTAFAVKHTIHGCARHRHEGRQGCRAWNRRFCRRRGDGVVFRVPGAIRRRPQRGRLCSLPVCTEPPRGRRSRLQPRRRKGRRHNELAVDARPRGRVRGEWNATSGGFRFECHFQRFPFFWAYCAEPWPFAWPSCGATRSFVMPRSPGRSPSRPRGLHAPPRKRGRKLRLPTRVTRNLDGEPRIRASAHLHRDVACHASTLAAPLGGNASRGMRPGFVATPPHSTRGRSRERPRQHERCAPGHRPRHTPHENAKRPESRLAEKAHKKTGECRLSPVSPKSP